MLTVRETQTWDENTLNLNDLTQTIYQKIMGGFCTLHKSIMFNFFCTLTQISLIVYIEQTILVSHIGSVPLQVPSSWQVLVALPVSVPSSHVKVQVSPGLATLLVPNWQEIVPPTGAKILGQMAIKYKQSYMKKFLYHTVHIIQYSGTL